MPETIAQTRAALADEISSLRLELELVTDPAEHQRIGEALDQAGEFLASIEMHFA